jgi:hypothetical protein
MIKSDDDDAKCTRKVLSKTAGKVAYEQNCAAPHASTSNVTIEATSPESMVVSMDMVQGGSAGKVHVDIKGRWLGASCAGIKDAD